MSYKKLFGFSIICLILIILNSSLALSDYLIYSHNATGDGLGVGGVGGDATSKPISGSFNFSSVYNATILSEVSIHSYSAGATGTQKLCVGLWNGTDNLLASSKPDRLIGAWSCIFYDGDDDNVWFNFSFSGQNLLLEYPNRYHIVSVVNSSDNTQKIVWSWTTGAGKPQNWDYALAGANFYDDSIRDASDWNGAPWPKNDALLGLRVYSIDEVPPPAVPYLNVFAVNKSNIVKQIFKEYEPFNIIAYWNSSEGKTFNSTEGYCNSSVYNVSQYRVSDLGNFSLCNNGCDYDFARYQYNFEYTNASTNGYYMTDISRFKICHINSVDYPVTVVISCNEDSYSRTIPKTQIPLCNVGYTTLVINSSICADENYINVTIDNTAPTINQAQQIWDFNLHRKWFNITESLSFNYTSNHWFNEWFRGFIPYARLIITNCTHYTTADYNLLNITTVTVINSPPKVYIEQLNTSGGLFNLSADNLIEYYSGISKFITAVNDEDLDWIVYTLRNKSGNIIKTQSNRTPSIFSINMSLLAAFNAAKYNFSVYANDSYKNKTFRSVLLNFSDSFYPSCSGLENTTTHNNTIYYWNVICTDEFFHSFNITCDNGFSYYKTNIDTSQYNYINGTAVNGSTICKYNYCDGHTKYIIDNKPTGFDIESQEAFIGDNIFKADVPIQSYEFTKKTDRITFCLVTADKHDEIKIEIPEGCVPAKNSKYKGHLTCDSSKEWIDFENKDVKVKIVDNYVVISTNKLKNNKVCFDSVGDYNCVNGTQKITGIIDDYYFNRFTCDMSTTPKAISRIGLLAILVALWIFILRTRIGLLNIIFGFVWLFSVTWMFAACFEFFTLILVLMGLTSMGLGIANATKLY